MHGLIALLLAQLWSQWWFHHCSCYIGQCGRHTPPPPPAPKASPFKRNPKVRVLWNTSGRPTGPTSKANCRLRGLEAIAKRNFSYECIIMTYPSHSFPDSEAFLRPHICNPSELGDFGPISHGGQSSKQHLGHKSDGISSRSGPKEYSLTMNQNCGVRLSVYASYASGDEVIGI